MSVRVLFHAAGADASDGDAAAFNLGACLPFNLGKRILGKFEPVNITDRAADTADKCACGSVRKSKRSSPS